MKIDGGKFLKEKLEKIRLQLVVLKLKEENEGLLVDEFLFEDVKWLIEEATLILKKPLDLNFKNEYLETINDLETLILKLEDMALTNAIIDNLDGINYLLKTYTQINLEEDFLLSMSEKMEDEIETLKENVEKRLFKIKEGKENTL